MNVLAPKPTTTTSDILASSQEWTIAGTAFVEIEDEVVAGDLGRLDLLATVPHMTAVIENKLFAHWHGANQADRYRDLGLGRIVNTDRKLGLVILSQNELQPVEDYPPDYVHVTWADFGRCLRRSLAAEPSLDLELMPVVYLIIAIEQDLVGLSLGASMKGLARLKVLQTTAAYMEGR